jgi:uncharacterized protein (DUF2147 family)
VATLGFICPAFSQEVTSTIGHWRTADGAAVARVTTCGQTICAVLVWLRGDPFVRDERNPNRTKHAQRVCGLNIFSKFRRQPDGQWSGGSVYDPDTGETIENVAVRISDNEIILKVGRGLLSASEKWQRVAMPALLCMPES